MRRQIWKKEIIKKEGKKEEREGRKPGLIDRFTDWSLLEGRREGSREGRRGR